MKYERFVQYTSNWYKIKLTKNNNVDQRKILKWCHDHLSDGQFHAVCDYYSAFDSSTSRNWIDGKLIELRFSEQTDFMEFVLIGDFYE